jgi:hypothetical protein
MLSDPLFIAIVVAVLGVLAILVLGIASFGKGGEDSRKRSNRLMQYRIGAQFVAVLLVLLFVWLRGEGG